MRKTILLALMAVVATTAVTAQETEKRDDRRGPNPEKRVEKQVKRLDKKLKLSDSQKEQLKEFYGELTRPSKPAWSRCACKRSKTVMPSTARSTPSSPTSRKPSMPR